MFFTSLKVFKEHYVVRTFIFTLIFKLNTYNNIICIYNKLYRDMFNCSAKGLHSMFPDHSIWKIMELNISLYICLYICGKTLSTFTVRWMYTGRHLLIVHEYPSETVRIPTGLQRVTDHPFLTGHDWNVYLRTMFYRSTISDGPRLFIMWRRLNYQLTFKSTFQSMKLWRLFLKYKVKQYHDI
jgi:hypothetical protein